jgi:hypothetical protein
VSETDNDEIEGRARRLEAAFPGSYSRAGAFVSFDMAAIKKAIGWADPVETASGLQFQRSSGHLWVLLETRVGNVMSTWSWRVSEEEWTRIVEALPPASTAS